MPKGLEDSENPGTEGNEPTPTDERQQGQIGDMLMDRGPQPEDQDGQDEPELTGPPRGTAPAEDEISEEVELPRREEEGLEDEGDRYGLGDRQRANEPLDETEDEGDEPGETPTPQPSDDVSELREQVAELRGALQALTQGQGQQEVEEPEPELPKIEVDPDEFLSEEDLDEFSVDPGKVLKQLAARVYQRAREDTLKDMPDVVTKATERQTALTQARNDFWRENTDLYQKVQEDPNIGQLLRFTANQVSSENPEYDVRKIFDEAGARVRKSLNLHKEAKKIEEETTSKPPNQPGKPRSKRRGGKSPDNRTAKQKQIDAMVASTQR